MGSDENPTAGQGAVVLDIGDDIGALVVTMPPWMEDLEVEIVPTGTDSRSRWVGHQHTHGAHHPHSHSHEEVADHTHPAGAPPHVAVVPRPAPDGSTIHSLVYGALE